MTDSVAAIDLPIHVAAEHESLLPRAKILAQALSLPMAQKCTEDFKVYLDASVLLHLTDQGLKLQPTGKKAPGATWVDFVGGAVAHRRKFGGGTGQMIAKAVGIKSGVRPSVLDATAGLGKDSFVLASLGCEVQMVERSPIIHALLQDGLHRAAEAEDSSVSDIISRMKLQQGNSAELIAILSAQQQPQVIYLDPMFPHTEKNALVKKEMRLFRDVVGDDQDASELLEAALNNAQARVVVKRPRKAPAIDASVKPSYELAGKSSRYDIYALKKLQ